MTGVRLAALLAAGFALAACGGGGSHTSGALPPATNGSPGTGLFTSHNAAPAAGAVAASVSLTIPLSKQTSSSKRRGQFISSYVQGIALQAVQNGNPSGFVFYPLTPSQNCTPISNGYSCSVSVQAPPGTTLIEVGTYDSTSVDGGGNPTGNLLSAAEQTFTISPGRTNNLTITTLPVAAYIAGATPPPRCPVVGTPVVNQTTSYTAYDVHNDDLTGLQLFNAIQFQNDNIDDPPPNGFSVSPATITAGSGTITYNYDGIDQHVGIFETMVFAGPGANGNSTYAGIFASVPVGTAGPHMVYVSDNANNQIIAADACSNSQTTTTYALPGGTNPDEVKYDRHSPAGDPRVFVLSKALNEVLWVDVGTSPGMVLATLGPFGAVYHVNDSDIVPALWVSISGNTLKRYSIVESPASLTQTASVATIVAPRGFGLEGSGNDMIVASNAAKVFAVDPTTLGVDKTLNQGGGSTFSKVTGPNGPVPSCAMILDTANFQALAVSVGATPANTMHQIGVPKATGAVPVAAAFFPPGTPGTGTVGVGGTTGIVATIGAGAIITYCDSAGTVFSQTSSWPTFMDQPAAMVTSVYASTAVSSLIYVTGLDQEMPVLQAFTVDLDHDLGSLALPLGSNPTDVTAGP